jgi:hypothetical protein
MSPHGFICSDLRHLGIWSPKNVGIYSQKIPCFWNRENKIEPKDDPIFNFCFLMSFHNMVGEKIK